MRFIHPKQERNRMNKKLVQARIEEETYKAFSEKARKNGQSLASRVALLIMRDVERSTNAKRGK